ncbi:AAA family ATPase [Kwoniella mangroviensis CBS 10435]|uniref:AAA family ATPase n=1 Tax=Kwoniella mangroviensis CBS 10435 TaxID=1331196 RepID=A0A1B9IPM3_9TREE|nr:AAA family ATPase [Kwoniella mangroviensis CBS 10435]
MSNPIARLKAIPDEAGPSASRGTREIRRAYLSPDVLRTFKLVAGDWVLLKLEKGVCVVQIWPRVGLDDDAIVLSSTHLSNLSSSPIDLYRFAPEVHSHGKASTIRVKEVLETSTKPKSKRTIAEETPREKEWLRASIKEVLSSTNYINNGFKITIGDSGKSARVFEITSIDLSTKELSKKSGSPLEDGLERLKISGDESAKVVYEVSWKTEVVLEGEEEKVQSVNSTETDRKISTNGTAKSHFSTTDGPIPSYINLFTPSQPPTAAYGLLGGLQPQIAQIKSLLDLPMLHPSLFSMFGLTPPRGILLHGPPGTGKTALARAVASSAQCSCIVVNGPELSSAYHGETEERLRGVFNEAKKRSPCIIVLDEVDALCPRRDGGEGGEVERRVVATLLTLMDGMSQEDIGEERIFVVAATNRPNSIDPALRRPGRFDREIEIGIPDVNGRRQIIDIMLSRMPHSLSEQEVSAIASRTHGYVGADLSSLIRESASAAIQRWHSSKPSEGSKPVLTNADVLTILPTIRPSAMREVFLETPAVRWSDIGGQDDVKQKLRECVEWPLTHRDTFARLGVEAPRGVLLYGPPGCSKTMTAKALATESGINFIAVKGPELLNKYVGESERAVREIFRKARAASPSIVFFDEIDALGSARSDDHTHSGVLTSLLNEMDGIEELSGVTVVAATNRPDVLDSALMRPGRLDRILYVGAPDLDTRKDIFRIRLATMAVEPGVDVEELARIADGCSGAEVASICQDAALAAMNEDLDAPYVKKSHLLHSARTVRRRITPDMISFFEEWRDQSGVRSA